MYKRLRHRLVPDADFAVEYIGLQDHDLSEGEVKRLCLRLVLTVQQAGLCCSRPCYCFEGRTRVEPARY